MQLFRPRLAGIPALAILLASGSAPAVELQGLLDVRAQSVDSDGASWTRAGLGKLRNDRDGLYLGQAVLRGDGELTDTVDAIVVLNGTGERADLTEAWLHWRPLPRGPWRLRVRAGAFFPALSLENGGPGWTPERTISTSAINTWIGEELRTKGVEAALSRRGLGEDGAHDVTLRASVFGWNDPAGTLMTWRGWSVGDRITGLSESLRPADLPVYRPDGQIRRQTRDIHLFRELDGRVGYLLEAGYGYRGTLQLQAAHYDNRGDPLVVHAGQYAWTTRFDHVGARLLAGGWDFAAQAMRGWTLMGRNIASVDFRAAYLMASHALGAGTVTMRLDRFRTRGADILPSDDNDEDGHAIALAYKYPVSASVSLLAEALQVASTRPARLSLDEAPRQRGRSLTAALRWRF